MREDRALPRGVARRASLSAAPGDEAVGADEEGAAGPMPKQRFDGPMRDLPATPAASARFGPSAASGPRSKLNPSAAKSIVDWLVAQPRVRHPASRMAARLVGVQAGGLVLAASVDDGARAVELAELHRQLVAQRGVSASISSGVTRRT
jgi:hypothetical protein